MGITQKTALTVLLAVGFCVDVFTASARAASGAASDLGSLSLVDLANVEVTSVSKSSEKLQKAAASIFVITHDAILSSGATDVMQALRLAPNILVTQLTASGYAISARGFGGNPAAQNFSNKLLMLIDGRSVYTPLYSGIYSDTVDVPLEDIDRIEVISGPGATLWGANAMNGVINIITRSAAASTGASADSGAGNLTQFASARYGAQLSDASAIRAYGLGFHRAALQTANGESALDGWSKGQGGFRYDWSNAGDAATVQGDLYRALEDTSSRQDDMIEGANMLARYERRAEAAEFSAQAYVDQSERFAPEGQGAFVLRTYDLALQQSLTLGRHSLVFGGGERLNSYAITSTATLLFSPEQRNLTLGNVFVEDTIGLGARVNLTAGFKMEDDPFSGWSPLPDLRVSWLATDDMTYWAAASRAIRSPTPFDTDVIEKMGSMLGLQGLYDFRPERLTAYQMGIRAQPEAVLSFSLTTFDHQYDDLRTIEPEAPDRFFPLHWGNLLKAETRGIEAWANWQVRDWWLLSPGLTWEHEQFRFKPGSSGLLGPSEATDDPSVYANLNSTLRLAEDLQLCFALRYVGARPYPELAGYVDADARIARTLGKYWEVSIAGTNLAHAEHAEFAPPNGEKISRSILAEIRWRH